MGYNMGLEQVIKIIFNNINILTWKNGGGREPRFEPSPHIKEYSSVALNIQPLHNFNVDNSIHFPQYWRQELWVILENQIAHK